MQSKGRSKPRFVALVGAVDGDVTTEVAIEIADRAGAGFDHFTVPNDLLDSLDADSEMGSDRILVILCTDFAGEDIPKSIKLLRLNRRRHSVRLVVNARLVEVSGGFALKCIGAGACDYLVRDSYNRKALQERLELIFWDKRLYVGYPGFKELDDIRAFAVFVATPYSTPWSDDYANGIKVAFDHLGVPCQLASDETFFRLLADNVARHIDNNTVVIANISSYGMGANANVFLEAGYSISARKKVILVRRRDDPSPLPADIQGLVNVEYINCADLALQLYFGFGGAKTKVQRR